MSNMSYCRFRNTVKDLKDCYEHMDGELSQEEHKARLELINMCKDIVFECIDENGKIIELPVEQDEEESEE